mmetsp:Transcript_10073/g.36829  ORF Transcript_10073/g.36829 Transcript_10073/m.36829 type:complete len:232 (-) Transcript_10073:2084-2779(-)
MADLQQRPEHAVELPAQSPAPFPAQFKEAVWSSAEEAKKDLKAWAQGQAFQLRIVQSYRYRSGLKEGKLYQVFLECHRAKQTGGTAKHADPAKQRCTRTRNCQCPMRVVLELKWDRRKPAGAQEWWALNWDQCNWEHNHGLYEQDKMMFNRQLPNEAKEVAWRLLDKGYQKTDIFDILKSVFPGNWLKIDLKNALRKRDAIPMEEADLPAPQMHRTAHQHEVRNVRHPQRL